MEVSGNLIEVMPQQSGISKSGNAWTKQEFIIETTDKFPKKILLSVSGQQNNLTQFGMGQSLKIQINIESREYQSKWYTNVSAWKIESNN